MTYKLVIKDAFWQILGRVISALAGFLVIKIITPYLGPLRYGDYSTILKFFAIWSAFADFGLYVIALKKLWETKNKIDKWKEKNKEELEIQYSKFVWTRFLMIFVVYTLALIISYLIPSYTSNPYIVRWLPIWMLFSASFMTAWILQIPLQLYWKMEQLSIALILARIAQISLLVVGVFFLFPKIDFSIPSNISVWAFCIVLWSVFLSWLTQLIYVLRKWWKYLKLRRIIDLKFSQNIIFSNRRYWLAYYFSSFHTLIVVICLSIFYPTINWFNYTGIWALALALIEILLIIPSALWNSLIHKISWYSNLEKRKIFWALLTFITRLGTLFFFNFLIFKQNIIYFISGKTYLSEFLTNWYGADFLLPFLAWILLLSFVKQIFNYIFVSTDLQNKLLKINFFGVMVWSIIWVPLILKYNLIWWIITQSLLEILFVWWAIFIAYKNNVLPKINYKSWWIIMSITILFTLIWSFLINIPYEKKLQFIIIAVLINILIFAISFKPLKVILKKIQ